MPNAIGRLLHRTGDTKNRFWFLDLLAALDRTYARAGFRRVYVVADNYRIHTAGDVCRWRARPRRFVLLWLPRYCAKANPIERVFGDRHDQIRCNHQHGTLPLLLAEAQRYLRRRARHGRLRPSTTSPR